MLVALAAPGFDADAVELALLRAGHTLAWRVSDVDEAMTQLAARAPEVLVVGDHPAVATPSLIGACDLLGVRACLLVATGVEPSAAAQRLGLLDVLLAGPDGVDVRALAGLGGPTVDRAPLPVPVTVPAPDPAAWVRSQACPRSPSRSWARACPLSTTEATLALSALSTNDGA